MNDSICLYICKRDEEGALLRYNFDPQACVLTKIGTEDVLRYVACLAINKTYLYTSSLDCAGNNLFSAYSIQHDDKLQLINRQAASGFDATYISLNPQTESLVASDFLASTLLFYGFRSDGGIGKFRQLLQFQDKGAIVGPRQDASHPHCTIAAEGGSILLTADLGCDKLRLLNGTGSVCQISEATVPAGSGLRHLAVHPTRNVVYAISEISSDIFVFRFNTCGELKLTQTLSNLHCSGRDGSIGGDIAVSPNGKWLAASNRGENNIVLYEIDGNGAIYYHDTVKTDGWARILRFDAASEYLFAILEEFIDVGAYSFPAERCASTGGIQIFHLDAAQNEFQDTGIRETIPKAYAAAVLDGRK